MAESSKRRPGSAQQSAEQGIIATTLIRLVQIVMYLILTLVFSIVIEWVGMAASLWDETGVDHSERMLQQELQYLNRDFQRSAVVKSPMRFADRFSKNFYDLTFKKTGVQTAVIWLATPTQAGSGHVRKGLHGLFRMVEAYVLAAMTVTQIFGVRLAVLTLAMPAFVLLGATGLVDGLVQRDIRRWSGGRESSFVYHWAKKALYPSLILPWIVYLAMPVSVHPNLVVLPFAVLFAASLLVMSSTFKKYL
ncbi:TIGR03747 family integrating conjugative element membrane protein [Methylotuvimicrobium sp. KM2]|uniref:TIGR03747 family integrating conjugative element membrane protein n=1 Tax=Methylotuvimicrobium sp. KM2 TaxID=3133976 RepID=UPI0031017ECB